MTLMTDQEIETTAEVEGEIWAARFWGLIKKGALEKVEVGLLEVEQIASAAWCQGAAWGLRKAGEAIDKAGEGD